MKYYINFILTIFSFVSCCCMKEDNGGKKPTIVFADEGSNPLKFPPVVAYKDENGKPWILPKSFNNLVLYIKKMKNINEALAYNEAKLFVREQFGNVITDFSNI